MKRFIKSGLFLFLLGFFSFALATPLSIGHCFDVSLKGNPTTGFQWEIKELPSFLEKKTSSYVSDAKPNDNRCGVGGTFFFTFCAKAKGKGTLILQYRRPWEETDPNTSLYQKEIIVQ